MKKENIVDCAKDLVDKELILKIALFEEAYNFFKTDNTLEDSEIIASNVTSIFFNQDIKTLKFPLEESDVLDKATKFLQYNYDARNIVIAYLRVASVIYFAIKGEHFPNVDSAAFELVVRFGNQVPPIDSYESFKQSFDSFMEDRRERHNLS